MSVVHKIAQTFKSKVPTKDRVPFWQKVAYGLGGPLESTAVWIPKQVLTPVYNIGLGLNPALISMVLMLWRAWDAFSDPVMGNFSDNARTRWGRRRPFIVLGAILTGLMLPVMWWVPQDLSQTQTLLWLLISGILFYTCFTIWSMPYYSLQLEMSPDYDERTNITAYRAISQKTFMLFSGWILALAASPMLSSKADGSEDLLNGMRYISIGLAVLTIVFGVLPGLFVKERYYAKETSKQAKQKLIPGIKQTLKTKPFQHLIAIVFCKVFGVGLVSTLGFYVNLYYVCQGDLIKATLISGVTSTVIYAPNLLAIPLCTWLSSRYGKRVVLYIIAFSGIIGYLSVYLFYTPQYPWLQLASALLISPLSAGIWLIAPSMQADVADYDELATGKRREGSFSAVFSWTLKATNTVIVGLGGIVLVMTGFDVKHGAQQPPHVLSNLVNFYVWIPVVFGVMNVYFITKYNLTREKMQDIRQQLEARRGAL